MPKKQYIVKSAVEHDNQRHEPGSTIVLDEKAAEALLTVNAVEIDAGAPAIEDDVVVPTNAEERLTAITTAIGQLDPNDQDLWLKDGRPSGEAIAAVLGWTVTAAERNAAWATMQPEA